MNEATRHQHLGPAQQDIKKPIYTFSFPEVTTYDKTYPTHQISILSGPIGALAWRSAAQQSKGTNQNMFKIQFQKFALHEVPVLGSSLY